MAFDGSLKSPIKSTSRVGAVLKNNALLSFWQGESNITLEKDYKFLTQQDNIFVFQKQCGDLLVVESSLDSSNLLHTIPFSTCAISAALKDNKLALVLMDNTLMYYDIVAKKTIFSQKYPLVLAINAYLASPQISSEQVIFPDLEGKILVYSIKQNKIIKDILVSSDKFFNNVIYLYTRNNYILAATAKRISAVIGERSFKYDVDVRDVLFHNDRIYALSIEGEILELDHTLKLLRKVRLPFAVLSGIIIHDKTLYTLEKGGYIIALDLESYAPLVYKNGLKKQKSFFYNQNTFFYDKRFKRFE